MLSLTPLFTINRVTVFGDHANKDQLYYLPEVPRISTGTDGKPQFTLMKYMRDITDNPAFSEGQQLGGGFCIFSVDLGLDPDTETQILREARRHGITKPKLAAAPFHEGEVRLIALDAAAEPVDGQARFVETVHGTAKPSLFGDLRATFSVKLSQEAVELVEEAFEQGGKPFGLVYETKFMGLRPAFDVTVRADYRRIYNEFNAKVGAQYMLLRAEIEAGFQKLQEQKAIEIIVNSFTDDADARQQRDAALQFFKEELLKDFFSPSLPLPEKQSGNILADLTQSLQLPQLGGRTLSQAQTGTALSTGPRTQVAQTLGAPPAPPTSMPGGPTDETSPSAMRVLSADNPALAANAPQSAQITPTPPGNAAVAGGNRQAAGGSTLDNLMVGFKLRFVRQEELKTFEMNWKEAAAVERLHNPNGAFGLLLQGLNRAEHFMEVNLDSTFFQRLKVDVESPTPFEPLGLKQIKAHLEYGDRGDGQPRHVDDLELRSDANEDTPHQVFTCSLDELKNLHYRYRLEFFFDPNASIRGQKSHYSTEEFVTLDRTLTIAPTSHVGILRVNGTVGEIDFDSIPRVQLKLGYDDGTSDFHVEDTFILDRDTRDFEWKVRLSDQAQRQYWYEVTYFLPDDQRIRLPRKQQSSETLVINEPWQNRIKLMVDAVLEQTTARLVLELSYQDPKHGYRFSAVKRISNEADAFSNLSIPVLDPEHKTYRYRITSIGTDRSVRRGEFIESTDEYLPVLAIAAAAA